MSRAAAFALAAPGCVVAAASVVALLMAAVGRYPMWPHQNVNLAEAAGVGDEAEVSRLIENGTDPNARYPVRGGLIFAVPVQLTPLEAATAADDDRMVTRLLLEGAHVDARTWSYLRCIAGGADVPRLLDELRPAGADLKCRGVRPPWPQD
jgi:hypothetical protein